LRRRVLALKCFCTPAEAQHKEDIMKFRYRFVLPAALILVYALATPRWLVAQDQTEEHSKKERTHYRLIDLGTLGGPHSYGSVNGDGFQLLNNSGEVASYADTSTPDPNAPNFCFDSDCFLAHAFQRKDGVMADLGALPGVNSSAAGSINARGWITGQSQNGLINPDTSSPEIRAVLWKHGHIQDLGTLGGHTFVIGVYVNDSGQVVGISDNAIPDPFSVFGIGVQLRAFLWEDGEIKDIGTLGGPDALPGASCSGQPHDVIVGASYTSSTPNASTGIPTVEPFLWKNGTMTDLGSLGGATGFAQCANHHGQIIGASSLASNPGACPPGAGGPGCHAFFWEDGVLRDLGTLGGDNSEAIWLNEAGDVAGSADLAGSALHHAVLWRHGKIHDLGTVAGDPCSRGRGINARGQVVGGSSDCVNFLRAFLWEEGGPIVDLNTLIPAGSGLQLTNAININDRGEILAKSDPLGVTPIDDLDLGHLVLLIPCEADEEEGCGDNDEAATGIAPRSAASVSNGLPRTVLAQGPLVLHNTLTAWRARFARQYHLPVVEAPKNQ
jgi:probable HAF family extracellular repeat protein